MPEFERKLAEVDALCDDVFDDRMAQRFRFYPRFQVFLGDDHARSVENTLADLIRGDRYGEHLEDRVNAFNPTPQECMFLDAACRVRTIGLLWGIFPEERTARPPDQSQQMLYDVTAPTVAPWGEAPEYDSAELSRLIRTFPDRSARFVQQFWKHKCSWSDANRLALAAILTGYLPSNEIGDVPEDVGGVRVRKIASLLRIATCCTLGPKVCPLEIRLQLKPDAICDPRKTHLGPVDWLFETIFDRGRNLFEIRANVPPRQDVPDPRPDGSSLPVASVDYGSGLQFLGTVIQDVIDTVSPVLEVHPNTAIRTVKVTTYRIGARRIEPDFHLPQQWLLPLASAINGAEVAGMTAVVLRSFCKYGFGDEAVSFRDQVELACSAAETLHPFNALVRKLVAKVRRDFDWAAEPTEANKRELEVFLDDYLIERAADGDAVADESMRQGVLLWDGQAPVDVAIVSDYGRCVLSTLIQGKFRGEVWLIEPSPDARGRWVPDASDRVQEVLSQHDINVRRVSMGALHNQLVGLSAKQKFVYLTGAKGIWCSPGTTEPDHFICSQGVWTVAQTVTGSGGRSVLLAEYAKCFDREDDIGDVRDKLDKMIASSENRPWIRVDLLEKKDFWKTVIARPRE
ncbi:MAG: hypothetical protein KJ000_28660 [Pirellulaceae bacterium]|nr:hypothetical protein [Pirellulaceae bacterium]